MIFAVKDSTVFINGRYSNKVELAVQTHRLTIFRVVRSLLKPINRTQNTLHWEITLYTAHIFFFTKTQVVDLVCKVKGVSLSSQIINDFSKSVVRYMKVSWHSINSKESLYLATLFIIKFFLDSINEVLKCHKAIEHASLADKLTCRADSSFEKLASYIHNMCAHHILNV